jgi:hypothetical protein
MEIAGCSNMFMYNYSLETLYKFRAFGKYHSTNNCMAYKKNYLTNHKYMDGLEFGEECGFTNHFTEPMIQLNPKSCIICSSHSTNTFDKQNMCILSSNGVNQYLKEVKKPITNYIPIMIYEKIKMALVNK